MSAANTKCKPKTMRHLHARRQLPQPPDASPYSLYSSSLPPPGDTHSPETLAISGNNATMTHCKGGQLAPASTPSGCSSFSMPGEPGDIAAGGGPGCGIKELDSEPLAQALGRALISLADGDIKCKQAYFVGSGSSCRSGHPHNALNALVPRHGMSGIDLPVCVRASSGSPSVLSPSSVEQASVQQQQQQQQQRVCIDAEAGDASERSCGKEDGGGKEEGGGREVGKQFALAAFPKAQGRLAPPALLRPLPPALPPIRKSSLQFGAHPTTQSDLASTRHGGQKGGGGASVEHGSQRAGEAEAACAVRFSLRDPEGRTGHVGLVGQETVLGSGSERAAMISAANPPRLLAGRCMSLTPREPREPRALCK